MKDKETASTSVFNMSIATLQRIDIVLKMLHSYNMSNEPMLILRGLRCLHKELYPFLDEGERTEAIDRWNKIKNSVKHEFRRYLINHNFFEDSHEFEFWMRDKLNEKGLMMAKPDDPGLALGQT